MYEAKNLGITFDEELSWIRHVNLQVAKAYGKLKHAYRFKNFLNQAAFVRKIVFQAGAMEMHRHQLRFQ